MGLNTTKQLCLARLVYDAQVLRRLKPGHHEFQHGSIELKLKILYMILVMFVVYYYSMYLSLEYVYKP